MAVSNATAEAFSRRLGDQDIEKREGKVRYHKISRLYTNHKENIRILGGDRRLLCLVNAW